MERMTGIDFHKGNFLATGNQLSRPERVLSKKGALQNMFSFLLSKSTGNRFYAIHIVSFELELTSYCYLADLF
jgi:hypothetical protein